jgi:hypothetical protein
MERRAEISCGESLESHLGPHLFENAQVLHGLAVEVQHGLGLEHTALWVPRRLRMHREEARQRERNRTILGIGEGEGSGMHERGQVAELLGMRRRASDHAMRLFRRPSLRKSYHHPSKHERGRPKHRDESPAW